MRIRPCLNIAPIISPKNAHETLHEVGVDRPRSDAQGHVTGRTQFYADRNFPGLLHLKMVRSPHHHAKIKSIDVSKALKVPGVVRVLTAADIPSNIYTILCLIQVEPNDEPVLAFDKVRFKGEQIVAVLADSERAAREGVAKVKVVYEAIAGGLRCRGGVEAGCAARQRVSWQELVHL